MARELAAEKKDASALRARVADLKAAAAAGPAAKSEATALSVLPDGVRIVSLGAFSNLSSERRNL